MKYLPLYYKWMKKGCLPSHGLCYCLGKESREEFDKTFRPNGYSGLWGYDGEDYFSWLLSLGDYQRIAYTFSPLRQNMILLMAAMNNEL